ncbi:hypothetical protein HRR83_003823 [Exophiala dermatitidis]|nr:hypothetical protein HRR79_002193 [Exophiala dermatitidis]KAJ4599072.1 hypothetical protein HRR83_003823 [Exophiala dermatitidis]KAJ4628541.1 hypothetical protein HRR86_003434 [Exophiala dermatitidis]
MWLDALIYALMAVLEGRAGLYINNCGMRALRKNASWSRNILLDARKTASPYSACILAYATSFVYQSGILSYTTCSTLRVLDLNNCRNTEKGGAGLDLESLVSLRVHEYACDIVVLVCDFGFHGQYLVAVNIAEGFEPLQPTADVGGLSRVILCTRLRSTSKLFVRHNGRYLVTGTYSALGNHDHHEWLLYRYDLTTSRLVSKEPLQLRNFFGSELGSTVCFTIFDGSFYALTNQTSFESEEVDWTSYYHFISFALDDPHPDLNIQVIWRRQHLEGPINDAWTHLGFQQDHRNGELLIVECRKEWLSGGSQCTRTYYTHPFHRVVHRDLEEGLRHPPNDRLSLTLDFKSNSRWEESWPRADRFVHTEISSGEPHGVKEYICAKTKWHGYHFNSQTFVDLVTDEVRVEGEWRAKERIKLRVVSRRELSPMVRDEDSKMIPGGMKIRPRMRDKDGNEMQDGEEAFTASKASLWPPDDAPQELQDVLCPDGRAGDVHAVLGDEGIVYMAGPRRQADAPERALIFVSFDPTFGFRSMKRPDGSSVMPKQKWQGSPSQSGRKRKSSSIPRENFRDVPDLEDSSHLLKRSKWVRTGQHSPTKSSPPLSVVEVSELSSIQEPSDDLKTRHFVEEEPQAAERATSLTEVKVEETEESSRTQFLGKEVVVDGTDGGQTPQDSKIQRRDYASSSSAARGKRTSVSSSAPSLSLQPPLEPQYGVDPASLSPSPSSLPPLEPQWGFDRVSSSPSRLPPAGHSSSSFLDQQWDFASVSSLSSSSSPLLPPLNDLASDSVPTTANTAGFESNDDTTVSADGPSLSGNEHELQLLQTWRENAAYLTIGRGFWLR